MKFGRNFLLLILLISFTTFSFGEEKCCKDNESMDVFETIKNRRSVRKFKDTAIPQEHIDKILTAAIQAPSSGNQQPWKFVVIQTPEKVEELGKKTIELSMKRRSESGKFDEEQLKMAKEKTTNYINGFLSAPVYIVVLTDNNSKWSGYNHHDGPLAAMNILLAARALGYGTVYATDSIPVEATKAVCNIPESYTRVCLIPVGVPVEFPEYHGRNPLKDFIINESF